MVGRRLEAIHGIGIALTWCVLACGSKPSTQDDAEADATSEADADATGEEGGEGAHAYATGIRIDSVFANQGVQVPLWTEGAAVSISNRNAPLVRSRRTLVRATWELDEGFESRDIEAVLFVESGDGSTAEFSSVRGIEGPASLDTLEGAFAWGLEAELVQDAEASWIELRESDPLWFEDAPTDPGEARLPAEGSVAFGFEPGEIHLEAIFVEVRNGLLASCAFDVTPPNDLTPYVEELERMLPGLTPTASVSVGMHEPVALSFAPGMTAEQVVEELAALREAEASDAIWIGILECGDVNFEGDIFDPSWTLAQPWVNLWVGDGSVPGENMIVRLALESLGVPLTTCGAGSDDPAYPYPEGQIGRWGYDVETNTLHEPTETYSVMAGCMPQWLSDYEWSIAWSTLRP